MEHCPQHGRPVQVPGDGPDPRAAVLPPGAVHRGGVSPGRAAHLSTGRPQGNWLIWSTTYNYLTVLHRFCTILLCFFDFTSLVEVLFYDVTRDLTCNEYEYVKCLLKISLVLVP